MPQFDLDIKEVQLDLKQPFGIARGTKLVVHNVLIRLRAGEFIGFGEAAPNSRYNEDSNKVMDYLHSLPSGLLESISNEEQLENKLDRYDASLQQPVYAARAALEMAWLDWYGRKQGRPLWKLWNYFSDKAPKTSYTIGLADIEVMRQKVREAAGYPILKVKLGTEQDKEIIKAIRQETDNPIRVDANEGWRSIEEAREMINYLAGQNIELVEQPLPAAMNNLMPKLKNQSPLPLAADESFMGSESLEEIADAFDIINIKLMKIGSMVKARKVIDRAKQLGLEVMIGCMIESSLANTAGAILALRAEYADLDGHLLIKSDPASGLWFDDEKQIHVPNKAGLGVEVRFHDR